MSSLTPDNFNAEMFLFIAGTISSSAYSKTSVNAWSASWDFVFPRIFSATPAILDVGSWTNSGIRIFASASSE